MTTHEAIVAYLKEHGRSGSKVLCEHLGISRQALNVHALTRTVGPGNVSFDTVNAESRISATCAVPNIPVDPAA